MIDNVFYDFEVAIVKNIPLSLHSRGCSDLAIQPGYLIKSEYGFLQEANTLQQPGPSTTDSMKPLWKKKNLEP